MSWVDIVKKNIDPSVELPKPKVFDGRIAPPVSHNARGGGNTNNKKKELTTFHYVDVGVNLTNKNLLPRIGKLLAESVKHQCTSMIAISHSIPDSRKNIELAREWNKNSKNEYKIFTTVGVHPHDASRAKKSSTEGKDGKKATNWVAEMEELITANRDVVVAIGECGLDYDRMFSPETEQREIFTEQLKMSRKLDLPLYMHERAAHSDFIDMIDNFNAEVKEDGERVRGLVHCFTGNEEMAKAYLERGFYLGITGWICDQSRCADLQAALPHIPIDRLMIETDAPYLTPKDLPYRPYFNGPQYIPHISATVAKHLGVHRNDLARATLENVRTLFGSTF